MRCFKGEQNKEEKEGMLLRERETKEDLKSITLRRLKKKKWNDEGDCNCILKGAVTSSIASKLTFFQSFHPNHPAIKFSKREERIGSLSSPMWRLERP